MSNDIKTSIGEELEASRMAAIPEERNLCEYFAKPASSPDWQIEVFNRLPIKAANREDVLKKLMAEIIKSKNAGPHEEEEEKTKSDPVCEI